MQEMSVLSRSVFSNSTKRAWTSVYNLIALAHELGSFPALDNSGVPHWWKPPHWEPIDGTDDR